MSIAAYEDRFDLCAVTGKRIFITEYKAYVHAHRLHGKNRRKGDRHAVHSFRCPDCGHFHLGHMTTGKKNPRPLRAVERGIAA